MVRVGGKQQQRRSTKVVFAVVGLLGLGLIADYLWASSPRFFPSSSYLLNPNPNRELGRNPRSQGEAEKKRGDVNGRDPRSEGEAQKKRGDVNGSDPRSEGEVGKEKKRGDVNGRLLSATFADLPAPELEWQQMASAPVPRLDGAAIQIKDQFFVFAGYGSIDLVHSHVDVYSFGDNSWGGRFDMPKEMAHSHLGMVTDGRYIYVISGQYGPQCRGPTARNFVLDTQTKKWNDLPPLPVPRYAPATTLWRGRLHVMGGSKENRHTPALEHWSLAVKNGRALEKEWRSEIPIPRGGPHRACLVVDDMLLVIGGQEGDFMAKPGSPIFKCSRRNEVVFSDVLMLDDDMKWKNLPPMPKPDSHIEFAWTVVNHSIVLVGGTTDKHPVTKKMILNNEIFQFNLDTQKWSIIGKLPYRVKTTLVGFRDGFLYFTSGQRDRGPDDPAPKKVIGEMWRTKLKLNT